MSENNTEQNIQNDLEEKDNVKKTELENENQEAEEDPIQKLEIEVKEAKDKYLRLYSEFDNYRKRTAKEKIEIIKNASEDLIKNLLPILDDFERARQSNEQSNDAEAIKEGFNLIYNKFFKTLSDKGLQVMETENQKFDPELHEALTNIPASEDNQKGKIMDTIEKGYYLNEKVVRYAKVVVGS